MLGRFVSFAIGLFLGCYFTPRIITVETPQIHLVESCNQPPINVTCPETKCNTKPIIENTNQWVRFSEALAEKLSLCHEARDDLITALNNEKSETEYYRKKYLDFSCSE